MKINLLCGPNCKTDYWNIDHRINLCKPEGHKFSAGYYNNLDPLIEDESCEEVFVSEVLNILQPQEMIKVIEHWAKKVVKGGVLNIRFVDIFFAAQAISGKILNSESSNRVINGNGSFNSVLEFAAVKEVLGSLGLRINKLTSNIITEIEAIKQ